MRSGPPPNLERGVAGRKAPRVARGLQHRAGLGAPDDDAVVRLGARPEAQAEHAGAVRRHLEDVAGGGGERCAARRRAEALRLLETQIGGGIEMHAALER